MDPRSCLLIPHESASELLKNLSSEVERDRSGGMRTDYWSNGILEARRYKLV
jgi:hypothetical protein